MDPRHLCATKDSPTRVKLEVADALGNDGEVYAETEAEAQLRKKIFEHKNYKKNRQYRQENSYLGRLGSYAIGDFFKSRIEPDFRKKREKVMRDQMKQFSSANPSNAPSNSNRIENGAGGRMMSANPSSKTNLISNKADEIAQSRNKGTVLDTLLPYANHTPIQQK